MHHSSNSQGSSDSSESKLPVGQRCWGPLTLHLYNPPQREPSKKAKNAMRGSSDGLIDCWIEPASNECYLKAEKLGSNGILCLHCEFNVKYRAVEFTGQWLSSGSKDYDQLLAPRHDYIIWSMIMPTRQALGAHVSSARDWGRNMAKRKLLVMQPLWTNRRPLKWHVSPNWRWPLH